MKGFDKATRNLYDVAVGRGREGPVAPADHRRSQPRHRPARPDSAVCPGRRGGRGRRRAHRSSRLPGEGQVRRPAGPAAASSMPRWCSRFASWRELFGKTISTVPEAVVRCGKRQAYSAVSSRMSACEEVHRRQLEDEHAAGPTAWRWPRRSPSAVGTATRRRSRGLSAGRLSGGGRQGASPVRRSAWARRTVSRSQGRVHRRSQPGDARRRRLQVRDPRPQRAAADLQGIEPGREPQGAGRPGRRLDADRVRGRDARPSGRPTGRPPSSASSSRARWPACRPSRC